MNLDPGTRIHHSEWGAGTILAHHTRERFRPERVDIKLDMARPGPSCLAGPLDELRGVPVSAFAPGAGRRVMLYDQWVKARRVALAQFTK